MQVIKLRPMDEFPLDETRPTPVRYKSVTYVYWDIIRRDSKGVMVWADDDEPVDPHEYKLLGWLDAQEANIEYP